MKNIFKIIGRIFILLIVVLIILIGVLYYVFGKIMCEDEFIGKYISPNTSHSAAYYIRDCGATTYFVDNIELDGNNIFRAEARYPKDTAFSVKWINDKRLSIETSTTTDSVTVFNKVDKYKGIEIQFDEKIQNGYRR